MCLFWESAFHYSTAKPLLQRYTPERFILPHLMLSRLEQNLMAPALDSNGIERLIAYEWIQGNQ